MGSRDDTSTLVPAASSGAAGTPLRVARHALAVLIAAAIAWLVFAAYRQPDFLLDFAALRLC